MQNFLNKITKSAINGMNIATFDTRISAKWVGIFGYAAGRISKDLQKKGGVLILPPEPFFVEGKEGPLKEGELGHASAWAQDVIKNLK